MKRLLAILLFSLFFSLPAFSDIESVTSFSLVENSPFTSVAYYGDFQDIFSNPAALPLRENEGAFLVSFKSLDNINFDILREENLGWLQEHYDQTTLSFLSRYVSLSIMFGSSFEDRALSFSSNQPLFNIYSNVDIDVDFGYAFPYFSIGANLKGGNSMVRSAREVDNLWDAIANAWFSPFDRYTGRERFSIGVGVLFYMRNFSLGATIGEIFSLQSGYLEFSWLGIGESTTISIAAEGNRFDKNGDLMIVKPRASLTYSGFSNRPVVSYIEIAGELDFQFLPNAGLDLGVGYLEREHRFFDFKAQNGTLSIYLKASYSSLQAALGVSMDTSSFNTISPFFKFTYEM